MHYPSCLLLALPVVKMAQEVPFLRAVKEKEASLFDMGFSALALLLKIAVLFCLVPRQTDLEPEILALQWD